MMIRALFTCILLAATLVISACGMRPVYGTYAADPAMKSNLASVSLDNIPDRLGQDLRNRLIDTMYTNGYPGAAAPYNLRVTHLREREQRLGIAKDASTTRAQIRLNARIILTDTTTKTAVLTRNIQAISSYNNLPSQYTTLVAENSARASATQEMANQIVTALELYFSNPDAFVNQPDQPLQGLPEDELDSLINDTNTND